MANEHPNGQGIGARLLRKEDERHVHGRGMFVGDIGMPGLMEVAFLRSPLAHARIRRIVLPPEFQGRVFIVYDNQYDMTNPIVLMVDHYDKLRINPGAPAKTANANPQR